MREPPRARLPGEAAQSAVGCADDISRGRAAPARPNVAADYLGPRNAFILMRNSVYFGGNGTAQALIILLAYLVVFATILGILDWYRRPAPDVPDVTPETEVATAAVSIPAGVAV